MVNRVQLAIFPMICMNTSKVYTVLRVYFVMTNFCSERLEEAFVCINFLSKKPFHTVALLGDAFSFAKYSFCKKIRMKRTIFRPMKYTHCEVVLAIMKSVSLLHKNKS